MNRLSIAAATASLTLLAGCSAPTAPAQPPAAEDALTTSAPPADAAATTEAEPTEEAEADEPPEMPAEAMEQTEAGAEAFVAHYLETLNDARKSGDTERLTALAAESCESCANFEASAQDGSERPLEFRVGEGLIAGSSAVVRVNVRDGNASGTAVFNLIWSDSWVVETVTAGS